MKKKRKLLSVKPTFKNVLTSEEIASFGVPKEEMTSMRINFLNSRLEGLLKDQKLLLCELVRQIKSRKRTKDEVSEIFIRDDISENREEINRTRKEIELMLTLGHGGRVSKDEIQIAKNRSFEMLVGTGAGDNIECPAHEDTNPSMRVYPDGGHCFACGESFDSIRYVMESRKVSFPEAIRIINAY